MTPAAATDRQAVRRRVWLLVLAAALVLVLMAIGYVQWRQYKLFDTAAHFQNDGLGWSFSQLETEQLRLRNEMQASVADPGRASGDAIRLRYDIFVSRVGLVDHERAARLMDGQSNYASALALVRAFVVEADHWLGAQPTRSMDRAALQRLLPMVDALSVPLHDLSLGASHLLYQRATERNAAVRLQTQLSIALTAYLCLLLLVLAFVVLRQFRSLTERRQRLEAAADNLRAARLDAEAANRAKSAFLANMSHEIRTPFHGMLGMMSLLQDSRLTTQQSSLLGTARESAHHLLTILNDILDISQLESGKLQVQPSTLDLPQLVAQVESLMRVQAQAKHLDLDVRVAADVPRWVRADATRLKQILFNLLSNGVKFTPAGAVTLDVACGPDGVLVFTVSDSGIGMDEATLARLFQRFMQADESPSRRTHGTGLGLQISRDLTRLMGGDITVRSQPGAGSVFTVKLPLPAVAAPTATDDESIPALPGSGRALHVLVAEDHPVNRAYMEAVLDKLGHTAVFCADGAGAVRAVHEQPDAQPFDIVLMDLHMPGMDGFSATRAIRAMPAPRGNVPIVALTADAFHESRQLALDSGMDGFLTKPAHLPQLRDALDRYGDAATGARLSEVTDFAPPAIADPFANGGLDVATIDDVVQSITPKKYAALLAHFFDDRLRLLSDLRLAAATDARAELRDRAHALKGAAASLGLRAVAALATQLQLSPPGTTAATLAARLDALERQLTASREECLQRGLLRR